MITFIVIILDNSDKKMIMLVRYARARKNICRLRREYGCAADAVDEEVRWGVIIYVTHVRDRAAAVAVAVVVEAG